jgi:alpha-beta hydrolase superfamily lysophospholipase
MKSTFSKKSGGLPSLLMDVSSATAIASDLESPPDLTVKERFIYGFIFNEKRVYRHWYTRFLLCGLDLSRIRRVVSRVDSWAGWCEQWRLEGNRLSRLAEEALQGNDRFLAERLFHEAAGCYHIGQHIFYIDYDQKNRTQEKVREIYRKAIALYDEPEKPVAVEIPFRNTTIPGYLWRIEPKNRPLIILINGMDNLKETEQHHFAQHFRKAGFNVFTFDGPGQGEMWGRMKFIPDYHRAVSAILDWLEQNEKDHVDLERIGALGFSMGGYLAPLAAGFDKRIACAAGNGGPAYLLNSPKEKALNPMGINPLWHRGFLYMTGRSDYRDAIGQFDINISKAPPMDRPLLIFHSGNDKVIPNGRAHAEYFMKWAIGEKELKFYPDGDHVCANYLDEVIPYTIHWFTKHLKP